MKLRLLLAMAIRVLAIRQIGLIISSSPSILRYPLRQIHSLCETPNTPPSKSPIKFHLPDSQISEKLSMASVFQRYGFPQSQIHEFLRKNGFFPSTSASQVEECIGILLSFGLSKNSLVSLIYSCPRVLELGFLTKWQMVFEQLGLSSIPASTAQRVLEQSAKLQIEPDDAHCNVVALKILGFSNYTITKVFEELPESFKKDTIDLGQRVEFLKEIGLKQEEINRALHSYPGILALSIDGRLMPLFEEFRDLGIGRGEVRKEAMNNPRLLFGLEVGEISCCLDLLKSLKCRMPIKERILRNGHLSAGLSVKQRVDCLCRHGLTRRDAFKVLFVEPRSILYELKDIEKKIEFLLHKIGFGIDYLVEFPDYLGLNLEKQVIPRYNVIEHLRSNGALGFHVGMKHLVRLSRLKFYNLFVKPYPECIEIFRGPMTDAEGAKPRHPAGLWKVFKPLKFAETKEDVRNMKLFMESLV